MTSAPIVSAVLAAAGFLAAFAGMGDPGLLATRSPVQAASPQRPGMGSQSPGPAPIEEVAVPADSVLGLQLETLVTTHPEGDDERVVARVVRDVMVGGLVAVPTGSRVLGTASLVEKGPKGKQTTHLELRFDTIELTGGERVDIDTEPVTRAPRDRPPRLNRLGGGGAAGGALVGAIVGGGKGAAIGALGAAGAAATAPARDEVVELRAGTVLSVRTRGEFRVHIPR